MSTSLQSSTNFGITDWKAFYQSFNNPDLSSYDFLTLRKAFINYLQLKNPENFNDYIESDEYIALIDLIATMGQSMSFRFDMNARENFLSTAQTRNSINYLANLLTYIPMRNLAANGYLKISSISINEPVYDSLGNNLNSISINWNDATNSNWQNQWNTIINAVLINSQTVGSPGHTASINGINYSEYGLNTSSNDLPPYSFSTTINNDTMDFEIVNPTSVGKSYIYEINPINSSTFNLLYADNNLGFSNNNTGYFLYFKQGTLTSQTFSFSNSIPNNTITLSPTGINNTDVWLFQVNSDGSYTQWTEVDAIYSENSSFNNTPSTEQTIFSITNKANDAITLSFGDGVFGAIPVGTFICYMRTSNGETYRINPSEMSNVVLSIPYTSKTNRNQILTVTANLLYTVGNSAGTETLDNIKLKAPQNFYSQNRMVNGQDYNSFPYTQYSNLIRCKAINRSSSGVSRYLDVVDPTGKYSSTNVFCNDGFMYLDSNIITNNFSYSNLNNLASIIEKQIPAMCKATSTMAFILNEYALTSPANKTVWNMVLNNNTSCSGYFSDSSSNILSLASINSLLQNTASGTILQFTAPIIDGTQYAFNQNNDLVAFTSGQTTLAINQTATLYATITDTPTNEGLGNSLTMNGTNLDGTGAIYLTQKIPSGAILNNILPFINPTLSLSILQLIINYVNAGTAFSLKYYPENISTSQPLWVIDTTLPINYNPASYGTTFYSPSSSSADASNSWILAFVPGNNSSNFTVYQRSNAYYFGSLQQTSFYYDATAKVYDAVNAVTINDTITILQSNTAPGTSTNLGLSKDIKINISGTVSESNGLIDTSRVAVQSNDIQEGSTPSNPFFFNDCISTSDFIFLVTDTSQNTTSLIDSSSTATLVVANTNIITTNLYSYANGTIIYCTANRSFYQINRSGSVATITLLNNDGDTLHYSYFNGRQNLQFHYQHHAADSRRIDPSPSNLIDLYCLEASYATAYQQWVTDQTGQVTEPDPPTTDTLSNDFSALANYKMVSDELIFNSAKFVPLFGSKADASLQATFVAVVNPNISIGNGEIASRIITHINDYFAIGNFDFGQTMYSAQLITYVLSKMNSVLNALHIVPTAGNLSYGALEQITCNPYEIFISCATPQDISIVTSLNNLNLKIN
jgi:hypothetical protein